MFVPISYVTQNYAWGSPTAIAELFSSKPSGEPEAEVWFGAHPAAPSRVVGSDRSLREIAPDLPFLLKVLAASSPLSLQVHPSSDQARRGFAREERAGIPINASDRNYKDPHPKPELIYALSDPFRALSGFRPVAETIRVLAPLEADHRVSPLITRLQENTDLREVFSWLIREEPGVGELVAALSERAAHLDGLSWRTVRTLGEHYPGDPGIAISLLMHTIELRPGEAAYLPAGQLHAYIEGVGVELMGPSDNVLRGGLTEKHVDITELLQILDTRPLVNPRLARSESISGVQVFAPPKSGLKLSVVQLDQESIRVQISDANIVLCTQGEVMINSGSRLTPGQAIFVRDESQLVFSGAGCVFVAGS